LIISHHLWILSAFIKELLPEVPVLAVCHGTGLRQLKQTDKFSDYVVNGCRKLNIIFALNAHQKEEINELYGISKDKIIIIGNGYNSEAFYMKDEKVKDDIIRFVYAGKLSYSKGVKSLIQAYNNLDLDKDKVELMLLGGGNGEEFESIKKLTANSELRISLRGLVSQEKLGKIFRKVDIFCLPSFYEGLPLVLIEALASGLRVVTTDLPGVREWLGEIINGSGAMEYVRLPRLKETDIPVEEDLPRFQKCLSKAMEKQIGKLSDTSYLENQEFIDVVKSMSWKGVLERMESYF
jgi:glycosyltransferase involved in cell wall biosynthesis